MTGIAKRGEVALKDRSLAAEPYGATNGTEREHRQPKAEAVMCQGIFAGNEKNCWAKNDRWGFI